MSIWQPYRDQPSRITNIAVVQRIAMFGGRAYLNRSVDAAADVEFVIECDAIGSFPVVTYFIRRDEWCHARYDREHGEKVDDALTEQWANEDTVQAPRCRERVEKVLAQWPVDPCDLSEFGVPPLTMADRAVLLPMMENVLRGSRNGIWPPGHEFA